MNRIMVTILAIALIGGLVKFLDYRGDKKVQEAMLERAKKAVNDGSAETGLPKPSVFNSQYSGTQILKMQKIDDLTLKHTLQLDAGYDNLSGKDTTKMQSYFKDYTTSAVCMRPNFRDLVKAGMKNQFEYQFHNGQKITEFMVTAKDCEPYWKAEESSKGIPTKN